MRTGFSSSSTGQCYRYGIIYLVIEDKNKSVVAGTPRREDILVTAYSPSGRPLNCPLKSADGTNSATFKPDEPGEWRIEITYQGKQIQVSTYFLHSF